MGQRGRTTLHGSPDTAPRPSRRCVANGGHVRARSLMVKLREVHDPAILVLDPDGLHRFVLVHRM